MTQRAQAPWLSDEIRSAKRRRRIAERNWRSTKSESDWRTFKLLRNKVVFLMNKSRREFYTDFVSNISGDQLLRKYRILVLALMQLRICAALLTAIFLIVLRPLLLFAV